MEQSQKPQFIIVFSGTSFPQQGDQPSTLGSPPHAPNVGLGGWDGGPWTGQQPFRGLEKAIYFRFFFLLFFKI